MSQQIHFVTGKGGVGKSVVAASLALKWAQEGKRVLLVELGDDSFYADFFNLPQVKFDPVVIHENLSLALWTGDSSLREYAQYLIKIETLVKLFFENQIMKTFIDVAPALAELAIVGKITSGVRNHGPQIPYDILVVDAFATGHFEALLRAPGAMAEAIQFGPMGEQSRSINKVLKNPEICHYHIVTLPEDLPCQEALDLKRSLKNNFGVSSEILLNKVIGQNLTNLDLGNLDSERKSLVEFSKYLNHRLRNQSEALEKISKVQNKTRSVPYFFEQDPWVLVREVAKFL